MGVRGLMTFLEKENRKKQVNVSDEIRMWIEENPDRLPIIVIDFVLLKHNDDSLKDSICGGRHEILLENFEKLMIKLKATGATLVFYTDLNAMPDEFDYWLQRRDENFEFNVQLYDSIQLGQSFDEIVPNMRNKRQNLFLASLGLSLIAQKYGDFKYALHKNYGLELARYAKENDAIAVVTDDSDFLIFEGNYRYWKALEFGLDQFDQVITVQYDRNGLADICSIEPHQRALFATLVGNGIIESDTLFAFLCSLPKVRNNRFQNIAKYVIEVQGEKPTLNNEFKAIARNVFGSDSQQCIELVKKGVNSYDLNYSEPQLNDDMAKRLIGTPFYYDYVFSMQEGQKFTLSFYDMRGNVGVSSLPMILLDWVKRKTGIVRQHKNETSFTFMALIKTAFNENYRSSIEEPIYPDFQVPPLDAIYTNDSNESEIQWKLLAFIMSLEEDIISVIKALPLEFQVICTTLYAMVKGDFCSIDEADGILITEYLAQNEDTSGTVRSSQHPAILDANNIRVAHVYNNMMPQVLQNFTIAGLFPNVSVISRFDGVYYQNLMASPVTNRQDALTKCENYRIYV